MFTPSKLIAVVVTLGALCSPLLLAHNDVLLEFKGSAFLPISSCFKAIYGSAGALYGPELTVQLGDDNPLYAFASVEYFAKDGNSMGCCDATTAQIVPICFGLKYFFPFCAGDFYVGIGLQAAHLKTTNCSPFVRYETSKWGVGGITKLGVFINLPYRLALDLFFDYSFVNVDCEPTCCPGVLARKANIGGAILGAGLAYRF